MVVMFSSYVLDAVAVLGAILAALYYYLASTNNHWKNKGVPYVKPILIFGNRKGSTLMQIAAAEELQQLYYSLKGNGYGGIFEGIIPTLLIRDPELIKRILVKDFRHFQDRDVYIEETINPLEAHLFYMRGAMWRSLRSKLTQTFTPRKIKGMFRSVEACGRDLVEYLMGPAGTRESIEIHDALARYSTDVIGTCAFGLECNSMKNPNSEFRRMGRKIFTPPLVNRVNRLVLFIMPNVGKLLRLKYAASDVTNFFLRVVKETIHFREQNEVQHNDFMQLLIQLRNTSKTNGGKDETNASDDSKNSRHKKMDVELTDERLAAQAYVFFFAGFETSSTTMSFCLLELARNPNVQARLQTEIDSVLAECDGQFTYNGVQRMTYLEKVILEVLRMYPPVPVLTRTCTIPYTIPGSNVLLDLGSRILIPIHAIQNDPEHYPNPEQFDPERFSEENKRTRRPYTFLTFGEGPRACIGSRFGMLQVKIGLASLLSKYDFSVGAKTKFPVGFDPEFDVLSVKGGIHLKLTNRRL